MSGENNVEIWAQDCNIKGLRIIRFERLNAKKLRWLGPFDEADDKDQFTYGEDELIAHKWQRLED